MDACTSEEREETAPGVEARGAEYLRRGLWEDKTLLDYLEEAVADVPTRRVYVDDAGSWTFAQLDEEAARLARAFVSLGIERGDRVVAHWPNEKDLAAIYFACQRVGAVFIPLAPIYRERELSYVLRHAGAALYLSHATYRGVDYAGMVSQLRKNAPLLKAVVHRWRTGKAGAGHDYDQIDGSAAVDAGQRRRPGEVEAITYTSGTESSPKGVMHTHQTRLAAIRGLLSVVPLDEDDVGWFATPLTHATGCAYGIKLAVVTRSQVLIQDGFDPVRALEAMVAEGATWTMAATPFLQGLTRCEGGEPLRRQLRMRQFLCGGAPVPRALALEAEAELGCRVLGAYGSTESAAAVLTRPDDPPDKAVWRVDGVAIPGTELEVADEERRLLPRGTEGEVAFRGPTMCVGYYRAPELNRRYFGPDGWFYQGDLAVMDEDGYVTITGRKKDIIIRGGLNISAREVEEVLLTHPRVSQAALVAVPDERLGEQACAVVVASDGDPPTLHELCDHLLAGGLAKQQLPERLEVVGAMPMTPSGKIQKYVLRERFSQP